MWVVGTLNIWKQGNMVIFRNVDIDGEEIFTYAQIKAWTWITDKVHSVPFHTQIDA